MITVLGAIGFIGSHLVSKLREKSIQTFVQTRNEALNTRELGIVFYCIGLTADFRLRPFDTVEAHIGKLTSLLQTCRYESLVYLSSTRVYQSLSDLATEDKTIFVNTQNNNDLYNISKLMGESIALAANSRNKVIRLSNVYGHDLNSKNFLPSIVRAASVTNKISLEPSLVPEK